MPVYNHQGVIITIPSPDVHIGTLDYKGDEVPIVGDSSITSHDAFKLYCEQAAFDFRQGSEKIKTLGDDIDLQQRLLDRRKAAWANELDL